MPKAELPALCAVIFSEYSTVHFVQGALSFETLSGKNTIEFYW